MLIYIAPFLSCFFCEKLVAVREKMMGRKIPPGGFVQKFKVKEIGRGESLREANI